MSSRRSTNCLSLLSCQVRAFPGLTVQDRLPGQAMALQHLTDFFPANGRHNPLGNQIALQVAQ
jgi:hypothetical protein